MCKGQMRFLRYAVKSGIEECRRNAFIQGGVTNNAGGMVRATLPVAFSTPLTAVGTVTAATGSSSRNNLDDAVTLTSTYVQFAYYQHQYLAFGL